MIFFFKVILGKFSTALKLLLGILVPTLALLLFAPYLMDKYSPLLSEDHVKNLIVFRQTLFYFFIGASTLILSIVTYLFWWMRKYRLHLDSVYNHVEKMAQDEIRGKSYYQKLDFILNNYSVDFQKIHQKEKLRQNFLLERLDNILQLKNNLAKQLIDVEKIVRESTLLFDKLEKKVQLFNQDNLLYQTGNKFNLLNEYIFKIQLNVFNISIETFKDFVVTDEKVPPLAKEVETLIHKSGEIIEELYRILEETEENKIRGKKELIESLVETGRQFAQVSYLFSKFSMTLDKLEKSIVDFRKDLANKPESETYSIRESEYGTLRGILTEVIEKSNGVLFKMEQMLYPDVSFFREELKKKSEQKNKINEEHETLKDELSKQQEDFDKLTGTPISHEEKESEKEEILNSKLNLNSNASSSIADFASETVRPMTGKDVSKDDVENFFEKKEVLEENSGEEIVLESKGTANLEEESEEEQEEIKEPEIIPGEYLDESEDEANELDQREYELEEEEEDPSEEYEEIEEVMEDKVEDEAEIIEEGHPDVAEIMAKNVNEDNESVEEFSDLKETDDVIEEIKNENQRAIESIHHKEIII